MIKPFARWVEHESIEISVLGQAVRELKEGLFDANLGGDLYKKRIPLSGRGKRGGARTIIATRFEGKLFFLTGFAKNERDNITSKELTALRSYARYLLSLKEESLAQAIEDKELKEVVSDEPDTE